MGGFFAVLTPFGVCQSEGRLAGNWECALGGWLTSFMRASEEVGSGYLGCWLGVALDGGRGWCLWGLVGGSGNGACRQKERKRGTLSFCSGHPVVVFVAGGMVVEVGRCSLL